MQQTPLPPRTAYVLLWFPEPTETFLFREVLGLRQQGLPLRVFTLYDLLRRRLTPEMLAAQAEVHSLGLKALPRILGAALAWWRKDPATCARLWRNVPFRRWKGWEKGGENLWAFLCAFHLADLCRAAGIEHLHAPWASGPATAAWCAASLLGIPFSFTARAWDIHPPDGALPDKLRAASFVRCNAGANIPYLRGLAGLTPPEDAKIRLAYNGISLTTKDTAAVAMRPPFQLLAVGRFVGKKGFTYLLQALAELVREGLDCRLTLVGAGPKDKELRRLTRELGLTERVTFPGFVPHHEVGRLFRAADLFVMPSVIDSSGDRDGIPNVIMEALAHRLPVVASDVSGIGELVEHQVTGLLVPQRDAPALARAMRTLLQDRDLALRLAEAGRERALSMFDPQRNYRLIIDLLREFTPPR